MNTIKSITLALFLVLAFVFVNKAEAKSSTRYSYVKYTIAKNGSYKKIEHKSKKRSYYKLSHHHHKNYNHHYKKSTSQKVNNVATQSFQKNTNNISQAYISPSASKHIKERHWYNADQGPKTSYFSHSITDQKLNALATKTINHGSQRPSSHGQGRSTYQYRFNEPLGTAINGEKAYALRVVTDAQNNVITAFPVR